MPRSNIFFQVAAVNGILFLASIGIYIWILVFNSMRRGVMIASAKRLPLPGCPAINGGTEWALWIPRIADFFLWSWVGIIDLHSFQLQFSSSSYFYSYSTRLPRLSLRVWGLTSDSRSRWSYSTRIHFTSSGMASYLFRSCPLSHQ